MAWVAGFKEGRRLWVGLANGTNASRMSHRLMKPQLVGHAYIDSAWSTETGLRSSGSNMSLSRRNWPLDTAGLAA